MTMHNTLPRSINRAVLGGATLAAATCIMGSAPASAMTGEPSGTITTHEKGIVMECHGKHDGLKVYTSLYENNLHGSWIQVVLGSPDEGRGNGKNVERKLLAHGKVRAQVKVDGAVAKISGTAAKVGPKSKVHEQFDDAGYDITIDGTHRQLLHNLVLRYDGQRMPLTCDAAFKYNLITVKKPIL